MGKLYFNALLKHRIGINHHFLWEPFKVRVFLLFGIDGLFGPSSLWMEPASFHGSIGFLCCDTRDQAPAHAVERESHGQGIAADQSPRRVKDWQFAASIVSGHGA